MQTLKNKPPITIHPQPPKKGEIHKENLVPGSNKHIYMYTLSLYFIFVPHKVVIYCYTTTISDTIRNVRIQGVSHKHTYIYEKLYLNYSLFVKQKLVK